MGTIHEERIEPDVTKPWAHAIAGPVVRALAIHPQYRDREDARRAGNPLAERLFTSDKYSDRRYRDF